MYYMCTTLEIQGFIAKQDVHQEEIKTLSTLSPRGKLKTLLQISCEDPQQKGCAVLLTNQ